LFPDYPGPKISARAPGTAPPGVFEARGDSVILTDRALSYGIQPAFAREIACCAAISGTAQQIRVMAHSTFVHVVANHIQK